MVQNGKKRRPIIYFPTSEIVSKVSEPVSERVSAAEHTSKASSAKHANK